MKLNGGKAGGIWNILRNGRVYLRLFAHPDTPWYAKAIVILAVLYVIIPFDLIPDWILGFGIVDDLILGSFLVGLALKLLNKQLEKQNQEE